MREAEERTLLISKDEVRIKTEEGKRPILRIKVAPYNTPSVGLRFTEYTQPGCFTEWLDSEQDILSCFNHQRHYILGRRCKGTARFIDTPEALWLEVDIPNTSYGQDLIENVENGNVDGASFRFRCHEGGDRWSNGYSRRDLFKCELLEAGPVVDPVYEETDVTVAMRSLEAARKGEENPHDKDESNEPDEDSSVRHNELKWRALELAELA